VDSLLLACPASDHLDSERPDTPLLQHDLYEDLMTELGFGAGWSE
jgi:hypothetical protein